MSETMEPVVQKFYEVHGKYRKIQTMNDLKMARLSLTEFKILGSILEMLSEFKRQRVVTTKCSNAAFWCSRYGLKVDFDGNNFLISI